jgi:hypothetical protein
MPEAIQITPNYPAMFQMFKTDAVRHLDYLSRENGKTLTRKEVYDFVASLRIALCSATTVDEIVELRRDIDSSAEKMFAVLMKEQEEEDGS